MTIRFDDRVAIVTGAGAGLGRSHAMLLASRGAKVVVNDPGGAVDGRGGQHAVADKVVAEIKAAGGQAVANYNSVADAKSAQNIVDTAMNTWGRLRHPGEQRRHPARQGVQQHDAWRISSSPCRCTSWARCIAPRPRGRSCASSSTGGSSSPRRAPARSAISARATTARRRWR